MENKNFNSKYFLILLLVFLLSSCQHKVGKDGPPNFYIDETKIPDAIPKPEPLAKYGNMRSYRVFGKEYYVMRSNLNYDAIGTASWYGMKFHKRKTSSGEPYSVLGMTAAHRTLPLPTYVEVTNLKNNRKVVVKVNDRGPFHSKRLIDLSFVAAKKLGMIGHGTSLVRVRSISPRDLSNPFAKKSRPTFNFCHKANRELFYLQVGAFKNHLNALNLQRRLYSLLNSPVQIWIPSIESHLYRVHIGPLHDIKSAEKISRKLKLLGIASTKTLRITQ